MTTPPKPHSPRTTLVPRPLWSPDQTRPTRFMLSMMPRVPSSPPETLGSKSARYTSRIACPLESVATVVRMVSWSLRAKCFTKVMTPLERAPWTAAAPKRPLRKPSSE